MYDFCMVSNKRRSKENNKGDISFMPDNLCKLTMREQQEIELEILTAFKRLCEKHNLYYVLAGGTLLGAVRHQGFIPWDDDIDVLMPRPDYERLCQLIREHAIEFPPYLEARCWFTEPHMNIPFLKIVDLRTLVKENYMMGDEHLWIDIFAMDGSTENDRNLKKQFDQSILLRKILFKKQTRPGTGKTRFRSVAKAILRTILKPIDAKWLCQKIEQTATRYRFDNCRFIAGVQWGYGPQERIDRMSWMIPVEVAFEDQLFNAPSNYHEYLHNLYGDYMQLPPVEKRVVHEMNAYIKEVYNK